LTKGHSTPSRQDYPDPDSFVGGDGGRAMRSATAVGLVLLLLAIVVAFALNVLRAS
jgi:hypothetical protein